MRIFSRRCCSFPHQILTERLCFFVLLLGVFSSTIGTTVKLSPEINSEEMVIYLKEKATEMESRVSSLENRVAADLEKRIKEAVKDAETRALHEKNHLLAKMEEMDMESRNIRNDLSAKLEELQRWALEQRDGDLRKVTEVEMKCELSTTNVAEKLQTAEARLKKVDNHLLMEVLQLKPMLKEAVEKVQSVEEEMRTALERERLKTHSLQVQMTELNAELHSVDLVRKNMSSVADNLRLQLNESLSDVTRNMRIFENSSLNFLKDCANISYVARLDEDLKNLEKSSKNDLGALRSELSPRLGKLEEKSALCDDVPEMKKTLSNHNSQFVRLNQQLWDVKNSCAGDPPSLQNGKPLEFDRKPRSTVRYECDPNFAMRGNSTVRCEYGSWRGNPPICSFFDTTFILVVSPNNITCYSGRYSEKIDFSRAVDTGRAAGLPRGASTRREKGRAVLDLTRLTNSNEKYDAFECGFRVDGTPVRIAVPYNDHGLIDFQHPSKVAVIGDRVKLEVTVRYVDRSKMRWRRNGVLVPAWDGLEKVEIPRVQPADEGIYECYEEGSRIIRQALLRLIVRKCGKNRYGDNCEGECPVCYSGGVCHDHLGTCICAAGFTGKNCEFACGEDHVGAECAKLCPGSDCKFKFFCKPDPFGCACFPGFGGSLCHETCQPGLYGVGCEQECHCANGPESCDRITGACSGGCSPGWSGQSCQIAE